jgi:AraC-like DNA-binding protein
MGGIVNPADSPRGDRNVILAGNGRRHFVRDFPGPLSVKSVIRGTGTWSTHDGRFTVDEDSILLLNHRQNYTILIDSPQPVRTFCLFFQDGLVEQAWRCHTTGASDLLDDPRRLPAPAGFFERMHPKEGTMARLLAAMHREVESGQGTAESLEDGFLLVARELLRFRTELRQSAARVPAMRAATRAELFRRLMDARSRIEESLDHPLSLERIAAAACLSPYHLHRLFRRVFGETPHRYAVRRRLERAKRLLAETEMPVTLVCLESGFESLGSFSTLFRKQTGRSPIEFRAGARR